MAIKTPTLSLVVGRRFDNCGRGGIITEVYGTPDPASCENLGAVLLGGRATVDVVYDDGGRSAKLPEALLYSSPWTLLDRISTPDEILAALGKHNQKAAEKKAADDAAATQFAADLARLRIEYNYLHSHSDKPDYNPGRLAATNMRIELKKAFPRVKFSLRSDFNSVRVCWTDGPTDKQVSAIVDKYEAGFFDGMTDCYNYARRPFSQLFGDPKYVNCERSKTIESVRAAWSAKGYNPAEVPDNFENIGNIDRALLEKIRTVYSEHSFT